MEIRNCRLRKSVLAIDFVLERVMDYVRPRIFLCDLTYTQQTVASDVMPAAVGGIGAYLLQEIPAV
jgi:hypothetical protein